MRASEKGGGEVRPITYCLVPRDLAPRLHDLLRRHFAHEGKSVQVIVERRAHDRRGAAARRAETAASPTPAARRAAPAPVAGKRQPPDRRRIRASRGRRIAERRAALIAVDAPLRLPRRAREHSHRIVFVECLELVSQHAEDADTLRLVARIQAGDRDAFAILYMRYFDRVYGYLRMMINDSHAAEDGAQQVFLQVLEALPRYEPRPGHPFRAWLFIVARNRALYQLRQQGRIAFVDPATLDDASEANCGPEPPGEPSALDWISDAELLLFVERLPLAQRQVLLLRYMLGLSGAETARAIGRSHEDVRVLQHRALAFLRARLTAIGRGVPQRRDPQRVRGYLRQAPVLRARRFALTIR
jgi:RNA polymerase sigma-70 factor (ECF subfamily)